MSIRHVCEPAKTAEPIEMPFLGGGSVGPKEPCIRWGSDPQGKGQVWRLFAQWKSVVILAAQKQLNE